MKDVICFEVNDWHEYPKYFDEWFNYSEKDKHPARKWFPDLNEYAKENKLCIKVYVIDMAISLLVTAPKEWVEEHIPEFKEEWWQDRCVYKYPWPYANDCKYHPFSGYTLENTPKDQIKERENQLWYLHHYYTEEDIENFKPHNIMGHPSGEPFLDYDENNFGAIEVDDDEHAWKIKDGCVVEFDEHGIEVGREDISEYIDGSRL